MTINWFLPLAGFIVGVLVGLTGIGGGVLMTPLLVLFFGMTPSLAVGTDLVYSAFTRIAGAWQHWRQDTVDRVLVRYLALGSVPAALTGAALTVLLHNRYGTSFEVFLKHLIGVTLFLATVLMLFRFLKKDTSQHTWVVSRRRHKWSLVGIGALGGFTVGLTSVGSGTVIMALLALAVPLYTNKLVGTNVAHAALLVSVAATAYLFLGDVDIALAAQLLVGSIPGVLIGSKLSLWLPQKALRFALVGLLIASSLKFFV